MEKLCDKPFFEQKILLEENLKRIKEGIYNAAYTAKRDYKKITLLAATKTVNVELINHCISLGVNCIGENKVQELLSKFDDITNDSTKIHLIGHLQSNKVKKIIGKVDMIQSVDSLKLADEIAKVSNRQNLTTQILVEVNIGRDPNKSGVDPEKLEELCFQISKMKGISLKGLMTVPPICEKLSETRKYFSNMYKLFVDIREKKLDNVSMDILSMGMSHDYKQAILEGATMVRIGSELFGQREYK